MKIQIPKPKKVTILRFLRFHTIAYCISIGGCFTGYSGYWQTIFSVQTVDFNILSHTLPTKLSIILSQNNKERELEKTIHSNYGLFRIVVTDCHLTVNKCPDQKILYYSGHAHQKPINLNLLVNQPYDFLRDPPPLFAESYYPTLYLDKRKKTGKINPGHIIGRVYYIRGIQPSFFSEYLEFIKNPFRHGYRSILYVENTFLFLCLGFILWVSFEVRVKLLEAKLGLDRIYTFNSIFSSVIESEFSAKVANNLQQIDIAIKGIVSRLNYDTNNIIHDIRKAPILSNPDNFDDFLTSEDARNINPDLVKLLRDADESIKSIDLVVKELGEITNLEDQPILVQNELQNLKNNLLPVITKRSQVEFKFVESNLWILCNPWRLRSIVRNALYNSSAALDEYAIRSDTPIDFQPKIIVKCYSENNFAITEIIDNGPGIPLDIIEKLYESEERLNKSAGMLKGNGSLIVNAYLKFHDGKVKKKNLSTGGASISFSFPLISQPLTTN